MLVETRRRRFQMASVLLLVTSAVTAGAAIYLWLTVQLAYATSHGSAWTSPKAEHLKADLALASMLLLCAAVLLVGGLVARVAMHAKGARRHN